MLTQKIKELEAKLAAAVALLNSDPGGHLLGCNCYGCKVALENTRLEEKLRLHVSAVAVKSDEAAALRVENTRLSVALAAMALVFGAVHRRAHKAGSGPGRYGWPRETLEQWLAEIAAMTAPERMAPASDNVPIRQPEPK